MHDTLTPIALADIEAARDRIRGIALRTPLVRLGLPDASPRIMLKLENLQPIGSFKLRGAANAMAVAGPTALADGVYTASAGNMAQGVAWGARQIGVRCRVIVPETAPRTKVAAIERLGGDEPRIRRAVPEASARPKCARRLRPCAGQPGRDRMHGHPRPWRMTMAPADRRR